MLKERRRKWKKALNWVIVPYLLQVRGIADITTFGGPKKEYHVLTSPDKLRKYSLTLQDVMEAVEQNNQNTGGNIIERGEQGFAVRGLGAIKHLVDIQKIVLKADNGIPVFLRDVASVEICPPPPSRVLGYTIPSAKTNVASATEGIILLRRGENASEVLRLLKDQIQQLEANELPQGVHLRVLYDRSFLIDHSLETVAHTLFEGISIVMIILVILEVKLGELSQKSWPIGMAVKAEAGELAGSLSTALAALQQDGTVEAIFKRHGVSLRSAR